MYRFIYIYIYIYVHYPLLVGQLRGPTRDEMLSSDVEDIVMYIYIYIYIGIPIPMLLYVCIHVYIYICTYVYMYQVRHASVALPRRDRRGGGYCWLRYCRLESINVSTMRVSNRIIAPSEGSSSGAPFAQHRRYRRCLWRKHSSWILCRGGCSGSGVQWIWGGIIE